MNTKAIRVALAGKVAAVTGIEQSHPKMPAVIVPPAFAVVEYDKDYHATFGRASGLKAVTFTCMLWTSTADRDTGLDSLDDFLDDGTGTVIAAIETDQSLGGTAGAVVVDNVTGVGRLYAVGDVDEQYYGAQINVRVWST